MEYRNVCWNCRENITEKNPRCSTCGWYICINCGACERECRDLNENLNLFVKKHKLAEFLRKSGKVDGKTIRIVNGITTEQDYTHFKERNFDIIEIAKSAYKDEQEALNKAEKERLERVEEERRMIQRGFFRIVKKTDKYIVFRGPGGYEQMTKEVDSVHGDYVKVDDTSKCPSRNYYLEKIYAGLIKPSS